MNKQITKKMLVLGLGATMLFGSLGTKTFAESNWNVKEFRKSFGKIMTENSKKYRFCAVNWPNVENTLKGKKYDAKAEQEMLDTLKDCFKEMEDKNLSSSGENDPVIKEMSKISVKYAEKIYKIANGLESNNQTPTPTPKPEDNKKPETPKQPEQPENNKDEKKPEDKKEPEKKDTDQKEPEQKEADNKDTNKTEKNTVDNTQDNNKNENVADSEKLTKTGKNDEMKFYVAAGVCVIAALGCGIGLFRTFKKKNQDNEDEE